MGGPWCTPATRCRRGRRPTPAVQGDVNDALVAAFFSAVAVINGDPAAHLGAPGLSVLPALGDSSGASLVRPVPHAWADFHSPRAQAPAMEHADFLLSDRMCNGSSSAAGETCSASTHPVGYDAIAMVADKSSRVVEFTGNVAEIHRKPMIGCGAAAVAGGTGWAGAHAGMGRYAATSTLFSDKAMYFHFSRVVAPDSDQAPSLAQVAYDLGWRNVATLNEQGTYGDNFVRDFADSCSALGVRLRASESFRSADMMALGVELQLQAIKTSGAKVILLVATEDAAASVLRAAEPLGLTGEGYTWLGTDGWFTDAVLGRTDSFALADGSIGLFPQTEVDSAPAKQCLDQVLVQQSWRPGLARYAPGVTLISAEEMARIIEPWIYYVWDAVFFTAQAVGEAWRTCPRAPRQNCTIDPSCLLATIRRTVLRSGATGTNVTLDAVGDRRGAYTLYNARANASHEAGGSLTPVGVISEARNNTPVTNIDVPAIVWSDGQTGLTMGISDGDFSEDDGTTANTTDVALAVAFSVMLVIAVAGLLIVRARFRRSQLAAIDYKFVLDQMMAADEISDQQAPDRRVPREIERSAVTLLQKLGSGAFGEVWRANFKESRHHPAHAVAVKIARRVRSLQLASATLTTPLAARQPQRWARSTG